MDAIQFANMTQTRFIENKIQDMTHTYILPNWKHHKSSLKMIRTVNEDEKWLAGFVTSKHTSIFPSPPWKSQWRNLLKHQYLWGLTQADVTALYVKTTLLPREEHLKATTLLKKVRWKMRWGVLRLRYTTSKSHFPDEHTHHTYCVVYQPLVSAAT